MCGRFTLIKLADVVRAFPWIVGEVGGGARFNIAPSQEVVGVVENRLNRFVWGLIPSWAKDVSIGNRLINARAETLGEKPAFRRALEQRRCLIPADGFYEWRANPGGKGKTPMYIRMKGGGVFAFAGLWEVWKSPQGEEVKSCTIITTEPNELIRPIHNRMPAIVRPGEYRRWLDVAGVEPKGAGELLRAYPAEEMEAYAVSRAVNRPTAEGPELVEKAEEEERGLF